MTGNMKNKISDVEFYKILDSQEWKCLICLTNLVDRREASVLSINKNNAAIDHCHSCGHIRGGLCPRCNTCIGRLENKKTAKDFKNKYYSKIEEYLNKCECKQLFTL